ncbi:dinitrogenase iron-molybdenum cofactor biosynthesis protein [Mesotoga sp. Brook.08.105.5.1]|uniref:NifB/NifX family molybdenum-iron cluster-binding protein n=1 Tax=Mesotoga sp. Brook.08.105.5.1 TaxID=1421002 RepID=UPI000C1744C4|nr:NifB/NifX family molybdenum-iron cluster-binding protein [Mesotoga sp. Brook.08.105.5.1]PVD17199.1 dinitrogenase iron-molybdenum cofactor biosynthesis protein [Mesotoga sp. Brook.08.105.5.1]RAM58233.1 dinitrogenase iron-molybdenum cofactor biosynthesis protein [Mesotoga sp. SC_4PWL113PWK15]
MGKLIAIGTNDGFKLNDDHFGQSRYYDIYELDEGKCAVKLGARPNPYFENHKHAELDEILQVIGDCPVWIGAAMGQGSLKKLAEMDYEPVILEPMTIEEALKAYLEK